MKWTWYCLVPFLFYLLLLQTIAIWLFTIDDMYIPLRYAKHLIEHHGLVWNIGELPVEGYSNFSFVLLGAFFIKNGFDPVLALKLLGAFGLCMTAWGIYKLSRYFVEPSFAFIAVYWLLLYKGQIIWAMSGLETTCFQALIVFALLFWLKGMQGQEKNFYWSVLLLVLASITRSEGPFFIILFLIISFAIQSHVTHTRWAILKAASLFFVLYAPYFFWRLVYFGQLFPNPIYCKGFQSSQVAILDIAYLKFAYPFIFLSMVAMIGKWDKRMLFFIMPSGLYLLLLFGADPVVAFYNRLFLPAFVLLLPLSLVGLEVIVHYIAKNDRSFYYWLYFLFSFLISFLCIPTMSFANLVYYAKSAQEGEMLREHMVSWLAKTLKPGAKVVLGDSGLIPYKMSNTTFIDSFCLNNKEMGKNVEIFREKDACVRLLEKKPDMVILSSLDMKGHAVFIPVDACLKAHLLNNTIYRLKKDHYTGNKDDSYHYEAYEYVSAE